MLLLLTVPGYLEGNMVEGPKGEVLLLLPLMLLLLLLLTMCVAIVQVYNILRLNSKPNLGNYAVRLKFDLTSNAFSFDKLLELRETCYSYSCCYARCGCCCCC